MKQIFFRCTYIFLAVLLLLSLTACGTDLAETPPSTEPTETTAATQTTEPAESTVICEICAAPKIAVTSNEGRSAALSWYHTDTAQLSYGSISCNEMIFIVDAETALDGLADGTYDLAILPCASNKTPSFGAYEVVYLLQEAIIFVHGNPTPPNPSYDLSFETIRAIYEDGGAFYWDAEQQEPLVAAFRFDSMVHDLSYVFGIEPISREIIYGKEYSKYIWDAYKGSALHPLYYSFLSGEIGINGAVISVNGVYPTDATIADGTYPLGVSFYAVYPGDDPDSTDLAAQLLSAVQEKQ